MKKDPDHPISVFFLYLGRDANLRPTMNIRKDIFVSSFAILRHMNNSQSKFMLLPIWLYITGWLFFLYLFISLLHFSAEDSSNAILSGMYFIDFGVHEASHMITFFLPAIFVAAAGSIGEMSFTLLLLIATLKAKSYFAAVFAGLWVMLGFMSAGRYMADARAQSLPLIGPGETVQHDWHYVFSQLGWLNADTFIGGAIQAVGIIIGAGSLLFGLYLILLKLSTPKV
ncbi:MAG TPA: hypothetical protein VEV15_01645 [Flavisolibacter sp.]|nr:hypothetical protein [Flavisolibacter sp.]